MNPINNNEDEEKNSLRRIIRDRENEIANLKKQINSIEKSIVWTMTRKWDRLLNRLLPGNNALKKAYYSILTSAQKNSKRVEDKKPLIAKAILEKLEKIKPIKYKKIYIFNKREEHPLYSLYLNNNNSK